MNTGSYINGQWVHPRSQRVVRNINPADPGEIIAEFPAATPADEREMSEEGLNFFIDLKTVFVNYGATGRPAAIH